MIKISLCMIVRDEESTLQRCLESVAAAVDEIIIVDTGSIDASKDIARKFTDKVFDFIWTDDFSEARNFSFSKADCEYLMWLDADDVLTHDNREKLLRLKQELPPSVNVVYMPYEIAFDEDDTPTFTYYRERIVKKDAHPVWIEPVHEVIAATGKTIYSDVAVQHRKVKTNPSGRNLKIMEKQLKNGHALSTRLQYYYARELMYNERITDAVKAFETFLKADDAWKENCISACEDLSVCYEKSGDFPKALASVLQALKYATPRAKTMCRIGELFLQAGQLEEARYWYEQALAQKQPQQSLGFVEKDYYGFIPAIQLCVVCDKMKKTEDAERYNEIAGTLKPYAAPYLYNKKYFESIKRG